MNLHLIFRGYREDEGNLVVTVEDARTGKVEDLPHVVHHSPTGYGCGYGGSGPADLALSMCAAIIGAEPDTVEVFEGVRRNRKVGRSAWDAHQRVKREIVAQLPQDRPWSVGAKDIAPVIFAAVGQEERQEATP